MTISGLNTAKDYQLVVSTPTGTLQMNITGFQTEQLTNSITSKPINSAPVFAEIPEGHSGTFNIDRVDSDLDDYFCNNEAQYFNNVDTGTVNITETISEANGAVSQYRFQGVAMKLAEGGSFSGSDKVTQRVTWRASRKVKVL